VSIKAVSSSVGAQRSDPDGHRTADSDSSQEYDSVHSS
jgi:hypothetical protein